MYISKLNPIVAGHLCCHAKGFYRQTFRSAGSSNSHENGDDDGANAAPKARKDDYASILRTSREEKLNGKSLGIRPLLAVSPKAGKKKLYTGKSTGVECVLAYYPPRFKSIT